MKDFLTNGRFTGYILTGLLEELNGTEVYSVLENEFRKFKDEFVSTRQIVPLIRHFSKNRI